MTSAEKTFIEKCTILADLWLTYKQDEEDNFDWLLTYGDLGFPLAFAISQSVIESSPLAEQYISELWDLFEGCFVLPEDTSELLTLDDYIGEVWSDPNA